MINIFSPLIIVGLFITWNFVDWIGMIGVGLILTFYWVLFFSGRKSCRQKLSLFEDRIVHQFSVFGERTGQQHYKYIYDNAHYYLMPAASRAFSSTSSLVTIGCLVMGVISIFKADWYSIIACVAFYVLAATLSSKFNKPYFDLQAVKNQPMASFELNYNLTGYSDFFKETWPTILREEIERRGNYKNVS